MGQGSSSGRHWKDPGIQLDKVFSQSHEEGQCFLYKLADYTKGGELLNAYRVGGGKEVEKLIREQFSIFMYNEGRGKVISRKDYLKWKLRNQSDEECVVRMQPNTGSRFDPLRRWSDHHACWKMEYRGSLGETLLHVLITCNTRAHTRIAKLLIKCYPRLAVDIIEGEEYLGASGLHLCIAYANNDVAADLVQAGASVSQKAIGSLFLPKDQQRENPASMTDYEGLAYLGETPLNWAASCKNESCYNLLLENNADPDQVDVFGNMVLHMIVIGDRQDEGQSEEMFGYALRHPRRPATNGIINSAGLTPLTLACRLARSGIFREMLELTCVEFWRYSNHTCSGYPLNALDTIGTDGRTNWNSALIMILNGKKDEHLNMLEGGIIKRLLEEKWQSFARREFLRKLFIMTLHLVLVSVAMYLRPTSDHNVEHETGARRSTRYCFEVLSVVSCSYYLVFQSGSEIKNQGLLPFLVQLFHDPVQLAFNISNLMFVACIPLRALQMRVLEDLLITLAVPGCWFHLMFFAGAIPLTGPFVTMIFKILTNDMITFFIIYTIFLLAFTQAFFFLYKGVKDRDSTKFATYLDTWMALFQMTMGDYDYGELSESPYASMLLVTFVLFMALMPILLLNMLIAMMGNTYATVVQQSEKEWVKQWANIVITLERGLGSEKCKNFMEAYSLALPTGKDQRGVMIIKTKSKTKARQRKGALTNWKKVGMVTMRALKRRKITGEQLRREMWGLDSIHTTPEKGKRKRRGAPAVPTNSQPIDANILTCALEQISTMTSTVPIEPNTSMEKLTSRVLTTTDSSHHQQVHDKNSLVQGVLHELDKSASTDRPQQNIVTKNATESMPHEDNEPASIFPRRLRPPNRVHPMPANIGVATHTNNTLPGTMQLPIHQDMTTGVPSQDEIHREDAEESRKKTSQQIAGEVLNSTIIEVFDGGSETQSFVSSSMVSNIQPLASISERSNEKTNTIEPNRERIELGEMGNVFTMTVRHEEVEKSSHDDRINTNKVSDHVKKDRDNLPSTQPITTTDSPSVESKPSTSLTGTLDKVQDTTETREQNQPNYQPQAVLDESSQFGNKSTPSAGSSSNVAHFEPDNRPVTIQSIHPRPIHEPVTATEEILTSNTSVVMATNEQVRHAMLPVDSPARARNSVPQLTSNWTSFPDTIIDCDSATNEPSAQDITTVHPPSSIQHPQDGVTSFVADATQHITDNPRPHWEEMDDEQSTTSILSHCSVSEDQQHDVSQGQLGEDQQVVLDIDVDAGETRGV